MRRVRWLLNLSIWPSKCQFFAVAGTLFISNDHIGTVYSHSDETDVLLIGQHWPVEKAKTFKELKL
jgi:hypothetical protein